MVLPAVGVAYEGFELENKGNESECHTTPKELNVHHRQSLLAANKEPSPPNAEGVQHLPDTGFLRNLVVSLDPGKGFWTEVNCVAISFVQPASGLR
ncbi:hypothetical protein [Gaoshiqia sediminis]|uniref:Uncharacterized protein n=1 Tax=Gaoshiqia sediminis TaxID=2986998 RepID=A0AA41Y0X7_9BACT|nr:hypothetical protein [Gaoshiqia sediminis]MCW0481431.1 hypothetical protein [Gaoshiqia sediminis]